MAIAAQRFSMLDQETNVGTGSFTIPEDSVFNTRLNEDVIPNPTVDQLIDSGIAANAKEQAETAAAAVAETDSTSILDKATRWVKGATPSFTDLGKLPTAIKGQVLGTITGGNSAATKTLDGLLNKCSASNGLGLGIPGRLPDATINCANGNGNVKVGQGGSSMGGCSANSYSDLLNKLTGGGYSSLFKDAGSALRAIMALAGYGYNLGMCGIFGAVIGNGGPGASLTNLQQSMAAGSLMSTLGLGSNTNGFLDVAKSSAGLTPLLYNPGAIGDFLDNFSSGHDGLAEYGMCNMSDRAWAGGDLLSDSWNKSSDDLPSLSEMSGFSQDLGDVTGASLADRSFGDNLDDIPMSDDDFFKGAYCMGDYDSSNDLTSDVDSLW